MKISDLNFELLISQAEIEKRVMAIGAQLNADYNDATPVLIGVLTGSFLFFADLVKQLNIPCEITFIKLASYQGTTSSRNISEEIIISIDIKGRDVVIIEDIVDTGNTAHYLVNKLKLSGPASIKLCALLFKPAALVREIDELKYIGFEIINEFVIGYGLDYNQMGRNLNDIYKQVD